VKLAVDGLVANDFNMARGKFKRQAQSRQAEICNHHLPPAIEHDVGWLQIAVQHALGMGRGQTGAKLARDFQSLVRGQAPNTPLSVTASPFEYLIVFKVARWTLILKGLTCFHYWYSNKLLISHDLET
jgi:hypothetical protein